MDYLLRPMEGGQHYSQTLAGHGGSRGPRWTMRWLSGHGIHRKDGERSWSTGHPHMTAVGSWAGVSASAAGRAMTGTAGRAMRAHVICLWP